MINAHARYERHYKKKYEVISNCVAPLSVLQLREKVKRGHTPDKRGVARDRTTYSLKA